jgi:PDZ domain-containing secreted protein
VPGDIIVAVEGRSVSAAQLTARLDEKKPGDTVKLVDARRQKVESARR